MRSCTPGKNTQVISHVKQAPRLWNLFSFSAQLSMNFILLINVKKPTIVGILTLMSRINNWLWCLKPLISISFGYFCISEQLKFHAQLSWALKKGFITSVPEFKSVHSNQKLLRGLKWATTWENQIFAYAKTKTQISFAVTAKLISAFVFATWIVHFLFFLNPKFQASNHLLWLHSPVCVEPGRKSWRPVFWRRGSNNSRLDKEYIWAPAWETQQFGFWPGLTQTRLYRYWRLVDAWNFGFR